MKNAYRILVGKPEVKSSLKYIWKDNRTLYQKEIR
jgi:hypothetical protein